MRRGKDDQPAREPTRKGWQTAPPYGAAEAGGAGLSQATLHRFAGRAEKRYWQARTMLRPFDDRRFLPQEQECWYWKPVAVTVGFGLPALLCILGQFFVPALNASFGQPLGGNVDLARGILLFGGCLLLMIAAPSYHPLGWSPEEDEQILRDREVFRQKRRL